MRLTVIIPHYRHGPMTAYTLAQILKYKGEHDLNIIVVDNKADDGSASYLEPFKEHFLYVPYPTDRLQSHGIAINYALELGYVDTDYFLCLENDAYPVGEFVPYYEKLISEGYDAAGSLLRLSGGTYLHPCAALYRTDIWREADLFCKQTPYRYFPYMSLKEGFPCHLMVHNSIVGDFIAEPEDYIELAEGYNRSAGVKATFRCTMYSPVVCAFHNGMGGNQESVKTYGYRTAETDAPTILLEKAPKIINRLGYEPGQFFYYFMKAKGKKIFEIPTEVKWMPGRENQQQEYSITESNIHHIWGVASYQERPADGVEDIYAEKRSLPDKLYETLPDHQKIQL